MVLPLLLLDRWIQLLADHPAPTFSRGRKPGAFATEADGSSRYPLSRAAYARRLHAFKLLIAVDDGCACVDPIAETKSRIGSVRRVLWLYLYECLPDFPQKSLMLDDLLATHDANLLMQGLEKIITRLLDRKFLSDQDFAERILDDERMVAFARGWLARGRDRRRRGGPASI